MNAPGREIERLRKSSILKRSIVVAGRKTSVSLEAPFWDALKEIALDRDMTAADLVGFINANRQHSNLSSTIRIFILDYYRAAANNRQIE